ncbi:MAG: hypothetical protein EOP35_02740 [Rubrivivax sp.]|nr:MAG: hypothetical protein EOP35_02740 [Rubrivivax sp.]
MLHAAGAAVRRQQARLQVRGRSGDMAAFESVHPHEGTVGEAGYTDYRYAGTLTGGRFHIVTVAYYEGDSFWLVSADSARKTEVFAEPHLSPDGRFIVAASASDAHNINGVFIWEATPGGLTERLRHEPQAYALHEFVRWRDDGSIELSRTSLGDGQHCDRSKLMLSTVRLARGGNAWRFGAASNWRCQ